MRPLNNLPVPSFLATKVFYFIHNIRFFVNQFFLFPLFFSWRFRFFCLLGLFFDVFFHLEMEDSFPKPFGSRFSHKIVVKKFPHPSQECPWNPTLFLSTTLVAMTASTAGTTHLTRKCPDHSLCRQYLDSIPRIHRLCIRIYYSH